MTPRLPLKESSRAGRFKKKLIDENALRAEALIISQRLRPIIDFFNQNKITAAEFTALYVITILSHRFPGGWAGSKRETIVKHHSLKLSLNVLKEVGIEFEPNIMKRLSSFSTLGDILNNFALKSTPLAVNRAILMWAEGSYGLELMFRIPTPQEVLIQQRTGRRCVTVVTEAERMSRYILGERDSLSFTMHDLIHADHFFHHNDSYLGQLGFYGLLKHCIDENHFAELLKNKNFHDEFEYVIADMNAYAVHLFKCFKSAVVHYHEERDIFFEAWVKKVSSLKEEQEALLTLNTDIYDSQKQDQIVLSFLAKWRSKEYTLQSSSHSHSLQRE